MGAAGDKSLSFDENFADSGQVAAEQGETRLLAASLSDQLKEVERPLNKFDDGGKTESGLGVYGRGVATLCGRRAGRETAKEWARSRGFSRRVGLYLLHPDLGGDLLGMAGSDPLTQAWAREHHRSPDHWTIDPAIAAALKAADDD